MVSRYVHGMAGDGRPVAFTYGLSPFFAPRGKKIVGKPGK